MKADIDLGAATKLHNNVTSKVKVPLIEVRTTDFPSVSTETPAKTRRRGRASPHKPSPSIRNASAVAIFVERGLRKTNYAGNCGNWSVGVATCITRQPPFINTLMPPPDLMLCVNDPPIFASEPEQPIFAIGPSPPVSLTGHNSRNAAVCPPEIAKSRAAVPIPNSHPRSDKGSRPGYFFPSEQSFYINELTDRHSLQNLAGT